MKTVFIAGFFAPIEKPLKNLYREGFDQGYIVWTPQQPNGQLNLNRLKSELFRQAANGTTNFAIYYFLFRGHEHIRTALNAIIAALTLQCPEATVELLQFRNARDQAGIAAAIDQFAPDANRNFPSSLLDMDGWCEREYSGKLILHPRADRGVRKSKFEDVTLVYQSIDLLANEYRRSRISAPAGRLNAIGALTNRMSELGLELAPSITATRAGEQGKDYEVSFPFDSNLKRELDLHLKKGTDRDERNCLRIYFFWHDPDEVVVVGWLTSHLGTRAS